MSHFAVLVIGDNAEEQLRPYQENNMGDCPGEFLVFNDIEEEYLEQYKKDTCDMVKLANGELHSRYDNRFKTAPPKDSWGSKEFELPEGAVEVEVPLNERYSTFEEYMKDYCGYERDEQGRFGYYHNPNAKWDWYELGGRWTGFFKLKPPVYEGLHEINGELVMGTSPRHARTGRPGLMTDPAKEGYADSTTIDQIDFEGMMKDAGLKAKARYERLERLLGGSIPRLTLQWSEVISDTGPYKDLDIDAKRKLYWEQPAMKIVDAARAVANKLDRDDEDRQFLVWVEIEQYQMSKEEYIAEAEAGAIGTYAVLKDGEWHQRGEMGWFGCATNELSKAEWNKKFVELIRGLSPDTVVSVYDCHI